MIYLIVGLAVLARFVPHPPNFSPVYGALLFAGAFLKKRDSLWFPLLLLASSDFVLTTAVYHTRFGWGDVFGWAAYAAIVPVGWWLRERIKFRSVCGAALAAPTIFFLVSNFTVWLGWRMYPPTWPGLATCYVAALPFFGNSLGAGVLFTSVLFGGYEFYRSRFADGKAHPSPVRLG